MADTTALKNRIRAAIKANDNQEITGPVLQQALLDMVDELNGATETEANARQSGDSTLQQAISNEAQTRQSADTQLNNLITSIKNNIDNGYVYAGIATPSTSPATGKVFYIAVQAGTYTNFGSTILTQGINILKYNGSAWVGEQLLGVDDEPTAGSNNLVKSGGVISYEADINKKTGRIYGKYSNSERLFTVDDIPIGSVISVKLVLLASAGAIRICNSSGTSIKAWAKTGGAAGDVITFDDYTLPDNYAYAEQISGYSSSVIADITVRNVPTIKRLERDTFIRENELIWKYGQYTSQGIVTPSSSYLCTTFIKAVNADIISIADNQENLYRVNMFDANLRSLGQGGFVGGASFTINDSKCAYVGITISSAHYKKKILRVAVNDTPISVQNLYPNTIISNQRALQGSVSIWHLGAYNSDGSTNTNSNFSRTGFIPAEINDVISINDTLIDLYRVNMFDENFVSLGQGGFTGGSSYTIAVSGCKYIGITILKTYSESNGIFVTKNGIVLSIIELAAGSSSAHDEIEEVKQQLNGKANASDVYTKSETTNNFATKAQIESVGNDVEELSDSMSGVQSSIGAIEDALDSLADNPPSAGTITGNNVFTGSNTFTQKVVGIAGENDNELVTFGQVKNTLHRIVDAADFGALPTNTAAQNVSAINSALEGGNKTVVISKPGTYLLNDTLLIEDNTEFICAKGVVLKKSTAYSYVICNKGASTRTTNVNIILRGINIDCDSKYSNNTPLSAATYGCRGQINMFHVENVQMYDITIKNATVFAIQLCTFKNVVIDCFNLATLGDGVHVNRGENLVCRNGIIFSHDDAIPLNASDWLPSTPEVGSIHDCVFENIVHVGDTSKTIGHLVGKWVDWYDGMEIVHGDKVVSNGHVYRADCSQSANTFISHTEPDCNAATGSQADSGGFTWRLSNLDAVYEASIWNITYRNIRSQATNVLVHAYCMPGTPTGGVIYDRSVYPTIALNNYPYVKGVLLDGVSKSAGLHVLRLTAHVKCQYVVKNVTECYGSVFVDSNDAGESNLSIYDSSVGSKDIKIGNSVKCRLSNNIGVPVVNCNTGGKINADNNISALPSANVKGATCWYNDEPYYNNGSAWVSMVN